MMPKLVALARSRCCLVTSSDGDAGDGRRGDAVHVLAAMVRVEQRRLLRERAP